LGKKIKDGDYSIFPQRDRNWGWESEGFTSIASFSGDNTRTERSFMFKDESGLFIYRGYYVGSEIIGGHYFTDDMPYTRNKEKTLKITYKCENNEIYVNQYISVFSDSDVFSFSNEIVNLSDKTLFVDRIMSMQLDFIANKASVMTFDGSWARERKKHVSEVNAGTFLIDAKEGYSSSKHNPFFIADINNNGYLAVNLLWSGNHKEVIDINENNRLRVLAGINDYNFSYKLEKGKTLRSPEAIAVMEKNLDDITSEMHSFVLNHVIPERFNGMERPTLVNNWEGTYFDFTPEKLLAIADKASEVGLDMFVLDDGWFGKRINDKAGLGDWYDNVEKTCDLRKFKEELKKRNLKFGLWIEPEMINPDSDLYRAHPEYVMQIPGVQPLFKRSQLVLDYANREVCDYIVNAIGKILDEVHPDYIKWDNNRFMTDVYSSVLSYQGGYYYDYTLGYYYVAKRLTERYPEILFEGCASGGNRFDLGVAFYMPQSWCSDNADAKSRTFIQEGTLY
ncbi:MAG: alpha-galactosidase, partial [Clostridia bacterium]|nr:alpha-galactosidase [Clostridia bacterium]